MAAIQSRVILRNWVDVVVMILPCAGTGGGFLCVSLIVIFFSFPLFFTFFSYCNRAERTSCYRERETNGEPCVNNGFLSEGFLHIPPPDRLLHTRTIIFLSWAQPRSTWLDKVNPGCKQTFLSSSWTPEQPGTGLHPRPSSQLTRNFVMTGILPLNNRSISLLETPFWLPKESHLSWSGQRTIARWGNDKPDHRRLSLSVLSSIYVMVRSII